MNNVESIALNSPYGKTEECAKFAIDTPSSPYTLSGIATIGETYTLSFWAMADAPGSISSCDSVFQVAEEWSKHHVTFVSDIEDVYIGFDTVGTYYIYHPKLEIGNKATDWTPSPDDTESMIQQLADNIRMLVTDGDGVSQMNQTVDGWTFNIGALVDAVSTNSDTVADLFNAVSELQGTSSYVRIVTDENGDPCVELGRKDNDFKVRITNHAIQFADGTVVPTSITRQRMIIEKATVREEFQFGDEEEAGVDGVWIWKRRSNGNLGLIWKDVN